MTADIITPGDDAKPDLRVIDGGKADAPTTKSFVKVRALTEAGNAERLADFYRHRFRYCGELGGWQHFDGCRWAAGDDGIKHAALLTVRTIASEAASCDDDDRRSKLLKHAIASEKNSALTGMIAIARDLPAFAAKAIEFDSDPWSLNLQNGTLDLRTGQLNPHSAASMHTLVANVSYDAAAECPRWESFLEEIQPDAEVRAFLQRFAGYCLTGITSERVLISLYGVGRNGKSKFVDTLYKLLGDYACYPEHDLLLSVDGNRHTTGLADLRGKRLAGMSEVPPGHKFDEARLKRLTGDEPITARRMHSDNMTFPMTAKMILAVNDRVKVRGDAQAVWDRIREVPFKVRVPDDKVDLQLGEKLCAELPGILNWCLRGCAEWRRNGLGKATAITDATTAYRAESDDILRFIDELYDRDPKGKVTRETLRSAFSTWAADNGVRDASTLRSFAHDIRGRGIEESKQGGTRVWRLSPKRVAHKDE